MQSEARAKKNIIVFIGLTAFCLLLYWADKKSFILPTKALVQKPFLLFSTPFYHLARSATSFYDFTASWPQRQSEYQQMQQRLNQIETADNSLSICLSENEKIKKMLGAGLPAKWKFLPVRVIGVRDGLRIDKGAADGVQVGMSVVSESVLVGRISKVNQHDSLVQLPDGVGQKIPVAVKPAQAKVTQGQAEKSETRARGILVGLGGNKLEINHILQEERLEKDDYVLTTGEEDWLPDLIIGRVDIVKEDKTAIYQQASVLPILDYRKLETVFVVIKN